MIAAVVVEVVVIRLEHAPVIRILLGLKRVLAEENPVLVFDEEVVRAARLTTDVVQHRANFRVHVGHLVEHLAQPAEVVRVPAHVRRDEDRSWMLAEQVVPLARDLLEAREPVRRISALGKQRQLQPALVAVVDRLKELLRVGGVNEHRKPEASARIPDGIEVRVVDLEPRAIGLASGQAKAFPDFSYANRTSGDVRLELRDGFCGPFGAHVAEIDSGQNAHTILHLLRRADAGNRVLQPVARHVIGGHHHPDVQAVERHPKTCQAVGRAQQSLWMAVEINRRILSRFHHVRRRDERRVRPVVQDGWCRRVGRHAVSRTDLGGARRTRLAGWNSGATPTALSGGRLAHE